MATTKQAVYVVVGADGEYDDYRERWIKAFLDEAEATAESERMTAIHQSRYKAYAAIDLDDDLDIDEWQRRYDRRQRHELHTGKLLGDDGVAADTTYKVRSIPLVSDVSR